MRAHHGDLVSQAAICKYVLNLLLIEKGGNPTAMPKSFLYRNYRATTSPPLTKERKRKRNNKKRMHAGSTLVFPVIEMKIPIQIWYLPPLWQVHLWVSYFILQIRNHNYDNNWDIPISGLLGKMSMKSSKQAHSWHEHVWKEEKSLSLPINWFRISLLTSSDLRESSIILMLKNKIK